MPTLRMRIVGTNTGFMIIQFWDAGRNAWDQFTYSNGDFVDLMREKFPKYWNEFEASNTTKSMNNYFFDYGDSIEPYIFVGGNT